MDDERNRRAPIALNIADFVFCVMVYSGAGMLLIFLITIGFIWGLPSGARNGWPIWVGVILLAFAWPARYVCLRIIDPCASRWHKAQRIRSEAAMRETNEMQIRQAALRDLRELPEAHVVEP